jgi:hypothetical protein
MSGDPFAPLRAFKVVVSFYPVGSAPRLKVSKFTIEGSLRMGELVTYLSKILNASDVHVYVANSIELMDDQFVGDMVPIFGKKSPDDQPSSVNIHYSIGKAYL